VELDRETLIVIRCPESPQQTPGVLPNQ
jgi:hypothetical protein